MSIIIKVAVSGATGRMGQEVVRAVAKEDGMELVGAIDLQHVGEDAGVVAGLAPLGLPIESHLSDCLVRSKARVMVDFTSPRVVFDNARAALEVGVHPVIGTTGMSPDERAELGAIASRRGVGGLIAPNFAVGAVLMMKFAQMAAPYFPAVEIIELHHDQKVDAPSGTALNTAELIAAARGDDRAARVDTVFKLDGVRGGEFARGIQLHSVRLPGLVAHQEVLFGGVGQTLTIRHDSLSRTSFMPGVILAIRRTAGTRRLVYGLENLLFDEQ